MSEKTARCSGFGLLEPDLRTGSLLRRFWGVAGTIVVASGLASTQVDAVEAALLACGPLLIGLG